MRPFNSNASLITESSSKTTHARSEHVYYGRVIKALFLLRKAPVIGFIAAVLSCSSPENEEDAMALDKTLTKHSATPHMQSKADTRLRGPWLVTGKAIWITLVTLTLGLFVIGCALPQLRGAPGWRALGSSIQEWCSISSSRGVWSRGR